jgi:hypothetical protein
MLTMCQFHVVQKRFTTHVFVLSFCQKKYQWCGPYGTSSNEKVHMLHLHLLCFPLGCAELIRASVSVAVVMRASHTTSIKESYWQHVGREEARGGEQERGWRSEAFPSLFLTLPLVALPRRCLWRAAILILDAVLCHMSLTVCKRGKRCISKEKGSCCMVECS